MQQSKKKLYIYYTMIETNNDINNEEPKRLLGKDEHWYEKVYTFFHYKLYHNHIIDTYYNVKHYLHNLRVFQKQLWTYRPYDYVFQEELFAFGLGQLKQAIINGNEERTSANKKIAAIDELIFQLNRNVEEEVPLKRKVTAKEFAKYKEEVKFRKEERFNRIVRILKGQDSSEFDRVTRSDDDPYGYKSWVEIFDGTGFENWWD